MKKQTVYLPVNGDQEKYVVSDNDSGYFNGVIEQKGYFFTPEQLNEYTANVIRQALETAAEKANVKVIGEHYVGSVVKESITNTFEETFKKFEV